MDFVQVVYLIGLATFAWEDYKFMSIPALHTIVFCALICMVSPTVSILLGAFFSIVLWKLRVFAVGDLFLIIALFAVMGWYDGIIITALSGILLNVVGMISKREKLPYLPFLFIICLIWWIL